jgi:hypothetical protein
MLMGTTIGVACAATAAFVTLMTVVRSAGIIAYQMRDVTDKRPILPYHNELVGSAFFQQPLNHSDFNLGFFNEWYSWNATFWKGAASPIVIYLPGESEASEFLEFAKPDVSTVGVIAQAIGAAVVILEHRYFGQSSPFDLLTPMNLTYLTIENSMADVVRFAKNFQAPWAPGAPSRAADVPFVLVGGSYSGSQAAWIAEKMSGTYWAYIAYSPALQAKIDYWEYALPLMEYGNSSCVHTLAGIIDFIDTTLAGSGDEARVLKNLFGLGELEHDDFAFQLLWPLYLWRDRMVSQDDCRWCQFCENLLSNSVPVPELPRAPGALGAFIHSRRSWRIHACSGEKCSNSHDPLDRQYTDLRVDNAVGRQLEWLRCNDQLGGWITTAPPEEYNITLVSRFITTEYWNRHCSLSFANSGTSYSWKPGAASTLNAYTGGWQPTNARRIIYSGGEKDAWRELGASSHSRPGGPMRSDETRDVIVEVLSSGWHGSELITANAELVSEVKQARDREVQQIIKWVNEWYL